MKLNIEDDYRQHLPGIINDLLEDYVKQAGRDDTKGQPDIAALVILLVADIEIILDELVYWKKRSHNQHKALSRSEKTIKLLTSFLQGRSTELLDHREHSECERLIGRLKAAQARIAELEERHVRATALANDAIQDMERPHIGRIRHYGDVFTVEGSLPL